jgi:diguanylate cyclase (GGDEF)-like protein
MPSIRTLLVEDESGSASTVRQKLASTPGHAFVVAHRRTLTAAVSRVRSGDIDIVLLDQHLPDSSGPDAIARLHAAAPGVPIVVMTDTVNDWKAELTSDSRADDYLVKRRLSRTLLHHTLQQALERHRTRVAPGGSVRARDSADAQFRHLVADSADGVVIYSGEGTLLFINRSALRLANRSLGELHAGVFGGPLRFRARFEMAVGCERVIEVRIVACTWDGRSAWVASLSDITRHKLAQARVEHASERMQDSNTRLELLASSDPLTGLMNRRGLDTALSQEAKSMRRSGASLAVVLLDCDDFKQINATLGHAGGDLVLKEMAARLKASLRPTDHVGRIGGDEFLVLLPDTRFAEAFQVAERLRLAICDPPLLLATGPQRISASLGVESVPRERLSLDAVVRCAQAALQRSKQGGKNRSSTRNGQATQVESESEGLMRALQDQAAFRVLRQPVVRLADASTVGWTLVPRGPAGIFESPRDFFPLARERDLLTRVDLQCLRSCVRAAHDLPQPTCGHIQVLPPTLLETSNVDLRQILLLPASRLSLCVEISEQQLIGEPALLRDPVRALKDAGVRVAVRDVGFGRSSLETLILLEPDLVRFDAKLVRGSSRDAGKRRSLRRMVGVVSSLGSPIVADGIDAREDLELMRELGVAYGQGSLWKRPLQRLPVLAPTLRFTQRAADSRPIVME